MSKTGKKEGPGRLFRAPRKIYTVSVMQEILVVLFDQNATLKRNELFDRLGQILSGKKFSKNTECKRALDSMMKRKFIEYKSECGTYALTSEGLHFIEKIKYKSLLKCEKFETHVKTIRKIKKPKRVCKKSRVSGFVGYDVAVIIRRLFEHDPGENFFVDNFKRLIFDLMGAEWHYIKSCIDISSRNPPTHKQARNFFDKIIKTGLVSEERRVDKIFVVLTAKGAEFCGLQTFTIERAGKRDKFNKVSVLFKDTVPACGLRALKKKARMMQIACSA